MNVIARNFAWFFFAQVCMTAGFTVEAKSQLVGPDTPTLTKAQYAAARASPATKRVIDIAYKIIKADVDARDPAALEKLFDVQFLEPTYEQFNRPESKYGGTAMFPSISDLTYCECEKISQKFEGKIDTHQYSDQIHYEAIVPGHQQPVMPPYIHATSVHLEVGVGKFGDTCVEKEDFQPLFSNPPHPIQAGLDSFENEYVETFKDRTVLLKMGTLGCDGGVDINVIYSYT